MLFGCAAECWLKGLIVIDNPAIAIQDLLRHGHNLRKLAIQAGVDPFLDNDDRDYLDLLQSLIEGLGRYPAPKDASKLMPCDPAGDKEHWEAIQTAIWKRFEALELAGKTDNPIILAQLAARP